MLITEAQKEKNRQLPVRVNFVLDEFCNIPKIPDMPSMISAARSRNMRFYLVAQSLHQLKRKYGEDADTIKGNCDNWVFLTSKELALLNEISELCGNITSSDGKSTRRLISVSELQRLDKQKGEALIMHTRQYPIITEMADISNYKMFGIYDSIEIPPILKKEIQAFSLTNLLEEIKNLTKLSPFASEKHLHAQAKRIWKDEMKEYDKMTSSKKMFGKFINSSNDLQSNNSKDEKSADEEYALAKERAIKRITKLISKEYADKFISEKLYEQPTDDDYDDIF